MPTNRLAPHADAHMTSKARPVSDRDKTDCQLQQIRSHHDNPTTRRHPDLDPAQNAERFSRSLSPSPSRSLTRRHVQDALVASEDTLQVVHGVSLPSPEMGRPGWTPPPPSLERFRNLRVVTVTEVHHERDSCLPALPASVRKLTLDAGRGRGRCGVMAGMEIAGVMSEPVSQTCSFLCFGL